MLPPLLFEPILKRTRWGGRRLGELLGKAIGPESDYAESWEIADHADGQSVVAAGPLRGSSLNAIVRQRSAELFGSRAPAEGQFPLLIKYLDANDWLSLQVHPDDLLAREFDPSERGKTEAWIIMDALPDSCLCAGLQSGVTESDLRQALTSGRIAPLLNLVSVKPGDCFFVQAGTVHALGPGIVLAEIQQQSNLTFRLHDWGRLDANGLPRAIHIQESLRCTDFSRGPVTSVTPVRLPDDGHSSERLVSCEHFEILRHRVSSPWQLPITSRFRILMTLDGQASIESGDSTTALSRGSTLLIPAASPGVRVVPVSRSVTLLSVFDGSTVSDTQR